MREHVEFVFNNDSTTNSANKDPLRQFTRKYANKSFKRLTHNWSAGYGLEKKWVGEISFHQPPFCCLLVGTGNKHLSVFKKKS